MADNRPMRVLVAATLCSCATGLLPGVATAADKPADPTLAKVFRLLNAQRDEPRVCGTRTRPAARPLRHDVELSRSAQLHSEDMAANDYFDHVSLDGRTFADRIRATAYEGSPAGENIAFGQQTAREVVRAWMGSPPHCRAIMRRAHDAVGLGLSSVSDHRYSTPKTFWVLDFGDD